MSKVKYPQINRYTREIAKRVAILEGRLTALHFATSGAYSRSGRSRDDRAFDDAVALIRGRICEQIQRETATLVSLLIPAGDMEALRRHALDTWLGEHSYAYRQFAIAGTNLGIFNPAEGKALEEEIKRAMAAQWPETTGHKEDDDD